MDARTQAFADMAADGFLADTTEEPVATPAPVEEVHDDPLEALMASDEPLFPKVALWTYDPSGREVVKGGRKAPKSFRGKQSYPIDYEAVRLLLARDKIEDVKHAPVYLGGMFAYKPVIEEADTFCQTIEERIERGTLEAICLTCQERLLGPTGMIDMDDDGIPETEVEYANTRVVGAASDHARTEPNHAVIVRHMPSRVELWASEYRMLATC
jgi:hypothetical protein